MRFGLILCLLLAAAPAFAESRAELAFRKAKDWTVYIKASLDEPFSEDDQGSWFGSGMVVDAERGWVLTNAHVASHSYARLAISFATGSPLPATRVYVDPYLDLAVLAFDPANLPEHFATPKLECRKLPPTGHPVGAFGHPWGYRFTGTRGITSALTSRLGPDMLQTDAPINGGNSGGPLISLETGVVLGVNAAKISVGDVEGLGFAVPMPLACRVIDLMRQGRDPSPPEMLVDFAVDDGGEPTLAVANSRLADGAPGFQPGDEIVRANGQRVTTQTQFVDALRGQLNDVSIRVRRAGKIQELSGPWPPAPLITARTGLMLSGALFAPSNCFARGLPAEQPTLMIHHVTPGSEADNSDLQAFDRVISVNGERVHTLAELQTAIDDRSLGRRPVELLLMRVVDGDQFFVYQRRHLLVQGAHRVGGPGSGVPGIGIDRQAQAAEVAAFRGVEAKAE